MVRGETKAEIRKPRVTHIRVERHNVIDDDRVLGWKLEFFYNFLFFVDFLVSSFRLVSNCVTRFPQLKCSPSFPPFRWPTLSNSLFTSHKQIDRGEKITVINALSVGESTFTSHD